MQHRSRVLTTESAVVAICSCGWVGPDRNKDSLARQDAARHEITEARASASGTLDPRQLSHDLPPVKPGKV